MNSAVGVAFITGLARGQGRSHAVRLAREGYDISGVDICAPLPGIGYPPSSTDDLARTVELVEAEGRRALVAQVDTRDVEAMAEFASTAAAELGRLDVVVANAGVAGGGLLWEISPRQWDTVVSTVLTGTWSTIRATVPVMIEQATGGSIILIGSVAGLKGLPLLGHYVAAKHGVVGLCKTLAHELGPHRIRVNAIHPWSVNTPLIDASNELMTLKDDHAELIRAPYSSAMPNEVLQPQDISEVVAFLVSAAARHLTGVQLPVDLGVSVG